MSANSDIAQSPAVSTLETDFVSALLNGSATANIAAAVSVATLYGIFMLIAVFNFIREKHKSHLLIVLFGAIRVVAFSVRAYMQKHLTQNLAIVYEVFFAVGFVALIKLLYSLLMSWVLPNSREISLAQQAKKSSRRGISSLKPSLLRSHGSLQERFAFIALIVGAICSIIGATDAYNATATLSTYNKGLTLMRAGYTIYLVVVAVFCLMCLVQPFIHFTAEGLPDGYRAGAKEWTLALGLLVCGLLAMCKSVFQVYAIYVNPSLTFHNKLFYPLEVLPELLILLLLCTPGFMNQYLRRHAQVPVAGTQNAAYEQNGKAGYPNGEAPVANV